MKVAKFIRFHQKKRNDLSKSETMQFLGVSVLDFNRLRKLNLLVPIEGGNSTRKLYFSYDDVSDLWDEIAEFNSDY
jgi:hypothetical protein